MRKQGSVFILFLWVLILFSLLAVSAAFRTRLQTKVQGFETNGFEMNYDFLSAVNLARFLIDSDDEPKVDFKEDNWYGTPPAFKEMDFSERFDLEISDEESKIDLNKAPAVILEKFFDLLKTKGIRLETEPKDLAGSILAWRGQVSARGRPTVGFEQKKGPFESLRELELIQYISPGDAARLRPFVTVYGAVGGPVMRVNINTVHPYILEALVSSQAGGDFTKRELFQKIEAFRSGKPEHTLTAGIKQVFQPSDLNPSAFIQRLGLTNSPTMVQLVSQLMIFLTVDSQYFSVRVRSRLPRKESFVLDAVLGPRVFRPLGVPSAAPASLLGRAGQPVTVPLELLDWHIDSRVPLKAVSS